MEELFILKFNICLWRNYLKKVYGNDLSDNEIIDKIPFDLDDLPPENQYDKKLEELEEQNEKLTDIMGLKKENVKLKKKQKNSLKMQIFWSILNQKNLY